MAGKKPTSEYRLARREKAFFQSLQTSWALLAGQTPAETWSDALDDAVLIGIILNVPDGITHHDIEEEKDKGLTGDKNTDKAVLDTHRLKCRWACMLDCVEHLEAGHSVKEWFDGRAAEAGLRELSRFVTKYLSGTDVIDRTSVQYLAIRELLNEAIDFISGEISGQ